MSLELYLAYVAACIAVAAIPGPMVALVVGNALSHGARAGLLNVAGSQAALALMLGVLVAGLAAVVETMGWWFDWLRLAGAAYLVWLGIRMFRSSGELTPGERLPEPRGGFFLQGFLVMLSNPKVLLFFGAFIPQFVDPRHEAAQQIVLLGATAMAVATLSDGLYALLAARAGALLSRGRVRLVSRIGGTSLVGGGLWLALSRTR
ncbi:MAG: LysE family translocator [Alphaproteobacteria bacterium]|nr:LysE family translocator [Alphaproteobacteria bacterium]